MWHERVQAHERHELGEEVQTPRRLQERDEQCLHAGPQAVSRCLRRRLPRGRRGAHPAGFHPTAQRHQSRKNIIPSRTSPVCQVSRPVVLTVRSEPEIVLRAIRTDTKELCMLRRPLFRLLRACQTRPKRAKPASAMDCGTGTSSCQSASWASGAFFRLRNSETRAGAFGRFWKIGGRTNAS